MSTSNVIGQNSQLSSATLISGAVERMYLVIDKRVDQPDPSFENALVNVQDRIAKRAMRQRFDVIVVARNPVGRVRKNISESQWKKRTLVEKYAVANLEEYEILNFVFYQGCLIIPREQDGAIIGHYCTDWKYEQNFICNNTNVETVWATFRAGIASTSAYIQLADALALKTSGVDVMDNYGLLSGAITIENRDVYLADLFREMDLPVIEASGSVEERAEIQGNALVPQEEVDRWLEEVRTGVCTCINNLLENGEPAYCPACPAPQPEEERAEIQGDVSFGLVPKDLLTIGDSFLNYMDRMEDIESVAGVVRAEIQGDNRIIPAAVATAGLTIILNMHGLNGQLLKDVDFSRTLGSATVSLPIWVSAMSIKLYPFLSEHEIMDNLWDTICWLEKNNHISVDAEMQMMRRALGVDEVLPQAQETMTAVTEAARTFTGSARVMTERTNEVTETVKNTSESLLRTINGLPRMIMEAVGEVFPRERLQTISGILLDIGLILFDCIRNGISSVLDVVVLLVRGIRAFGFGTKIGEIFQSAYHVLSDKAHEVWDCLRTIGVETNEPEMEYRAEMQGDQGEERAEMQAASFVVPSVISALVGTAVCDRVPGKNVVKEVSERLRLFNLIVPAADNMIGAILGTIRYLPRIVQSWVHWMIPGGWWAEQVTSGEFAIWAKRAEEVLTEEVDKKIMFDLVLQEEIIKLHKDGGEMLVKVAEGLQEAKGTPFYAYVSALVVRLQKAHKAVLDARADKAERVPPFCICIGGLPEIGKSRVTTAIVRALAPEGIEEANLLYNKAPKARLWDRYRGQFAVVIDDFGATTDAEEYEILLHAVSNQTMVLEMASLDDPVIGKKGTKFESQLLVLTTNNLFPFPNGFISREAILRRRHIAVEMRVPMEPGGVRPDKAARRADNSHMRFVVMDPLGDAAQNHRIPDREMNYDDFLVFCAEKFMEHKANETVSVGVISDATKSRIARVLKGEQAEIQGITEDISPGQGNIATDQAFHSDETIAKIDQELENLRASAKGEPLPSLVVAEELTEGERAMNELLASARPELQITTATVRQIAHKLRGPNLREQYLEWAKDRCVWLKEQLEKWVRDHPFVGQLAKIVAVASAVAVPALAVLLGVKMWCRTTGAIAKRRVDSGANPNFFERMAIRHPLSSRFLNPLPLSYQRQYRKFWEATYGSEIQGAYTEAQKKLDTLEKAALELEPSAKREWLLKHLHVTRDWMALSDGIDGMTEDEMAENWDRMAGEYRQLGSIRPAMEGVVRAYGQDEKERRMRVREKRQVRSKLEGRIGESPQIAELQACSDPNGLNISRTCVIPKMALCSVNYQVGPKEWRSNTLSIMFVGGTRAIGPFHLFCGLDGKVLPEGSTMFIASPEREGHYLEFGFDSSRLVRIMRGTRMKDVGMYDFGSKLDSHKVAKNLFMTDADVLRYAKEDRRMDGEMCTIEKLDKSDVVNAYVMGVTDIELSRTVFNYSYIPKDKPGYTTDQDFKLIGGWQYIANTRKGHCGAVLVMFDKSCDRKIAGIHVCAGATRGCAERVTQEDIEYANNALDEQAKKAGRTVVQSKVNGTPVFPSAMNLAGAKILPEEDLNFTMVGVFPPEMCSRSSDKSEIIPSKVHGKLYPVLSEPAVLHPSDPRMTDAPPGYTPLKNGTEKFGARVKPPNHQILRIVVEDMKREMRAMKDPNVKRILTEAEAINGIRGEPFMDPLNMQSSPGWPYVLTRPLKEKGKQYLFSGEPGNFQISNAELRRNLDERLACMKRGERVPSIWETKLKDERRPLSKIKTGKTRVFTSGPACFTIATRQYCLSFCAAFYSNRLTFESAVGIDPEGPEWDVMVKKMLRISNMGFAGDFENYDGKLLPEFMEGLLEIINDWYHDGPENQLARAVIFDEIIHTALLCLNTVFYKHQGNPSGCPLTVIINTMVNMMYMRYCWLECAPLEYRDLSFYHKMTCGFIYGDDNTFAVHQQAHGFFNMLTVSAALERLGQKYTMPDKGSEKVALTPVLSSSFLKRDTEKQGMRYLPKLKWSTVSDMPNWIRKCDNEWEATHEVINAGLRFAYFYGQKVYTEMRLGYLKIAKELKWKMELPTWEYYNAFFGEKHFLPFLMFDSEGIVVPDEEDITYHRVASAPMEYAEIQGDVTTGEEPLLVESSHGITMTTGGAMEPEAVIFDHHDVDSEAQEYVSDTQWGMSKVISRPLLLKTLQWTVATPNIDNGFTESMVAPHELIPDAYKFPFYAFRFMRGNIRLRVQVKGGPFYSGLYYVGFVPLTSSKPALAWHGKNSPVATSIRHILLNASTSSVGELLIPFVHPEHYIRFTGNTQKDVESVSFMGTVIHGPMNSLKTLTTNASVTVLFNVSFEDWDFKVPKPTASGPFKIAREERAEIQGNITSNYNIKKSIGSTIGGAQRNDGIGHGATANLSAAELDKPNVKTAPPQMVPLSLGYFSNGTNVEFSERMTLDPGPLEMATSETFGTKDDEMDLTYLVKIPAIYRRGLVWSVNDAPGKEIASGFLCPLSQSLAGDWKLGQARIAMTNLDYFSAKFSYWTGSLKYKIQLVGNKNQTGQLLFALNYGFEDYNDLQAISGMNNIYLDMDGINWEWEIEVPYYATKPLRIPNGIASPNDEYGWRDYALGKFRLLVVNSMVISPDAPTSVDVNIWMSGGHDFNVHGIFGNNASMYVQTIFDVSNKEERAEIQALVQEGKVEGNTQGLIAAPTPSNIGFPFKERSTSVQPILKRFGRGRAHYTYTLPYNVNSTAVSNSEMVSYNTIALDLGRAVGRLPIPNVDNASNDGFCFNGMFGWFAGCYRAWIGSTRLKIEAAVSNGAHVTLTSAFSPDAIPFSNADENIAITLATWTTMNSQAVDAFGKAIPLADWAKPELYRTRMRNGTTMPLTAGVNTTGSSAVLFAELPFMSAYKFVLVARSGDGEDWLKGSDYSSNGTVLMSTEVQPGIDYQKNGVNDTALVSASHTRIQYWMSAGDEFRFGIYMGAPPVGICGEQSVWPDTYQK